MADLVKWNHQVAVIQDGADRQDLVRHGDVAEVNLEPAQKGKGNEEAEGDPVEVGHFQPEDGAHEQEHERPTPVDHAANGIGLVQKATFLGYHYRKHLVKNWSDF